MSGVGKLVAARFNLKDLERVEQTAKSVKKSPSRWLRDVALAELNGENQQPEPDVDHITCACGHTRTASRIQAGLCSLPGYDPGCPKCGAGQPQKLPAAAYQAIDRMTRDNENVTGPPPRCLECGALLSELQHTCQERPDHIPSGIALEQEMTLEEFRRRYPDSKPIPVQYLNPRSWSSEWEAMDQMEPGEAMARFTELRAGRQLPAGFAKWPRAQMVAWLEANWPI